MASLSTSNTIFLIVTIVVLFSILSLSWTAFKEKRKRRLRRVSEAEQQRYETTTQVKSRAEESSAESAGTLQSLDRSEIQQKLSKLMATPSPTDLKHGACCYAVAEPPKRAEYVCPNCGEKTLYTKSNAATVEWTLPYARKCFKELTDVLPHGAALYETQFCRKCSPGIREPQLVLKIEYKDGPRHMVEGVTCEDLQLLKDFLSGSPVHDAGQLGDKPLKDYGERLQELLGVEHL